MAAVTVTHLGKAYKQYPSRASRLKEWLDPRNRPRHQLHWVLQDISFSIQPGQALGIIGINGAGKSTLLKMITGTTRPTSGSIQINGRVAALLELGMGFHPDFTGRQNVYMAGQLLGYSVADITELMPAIEDFAGIGEYIDQPVRVYSSGMQMRLAFSVATARRPDVLIVDEALSVGDSFFQHKSFERIRQYRQQGSTLLIVSHDKQAIQSICDSAILLSAGRLLMQGEPEAVMDYYNAMLADHQGQQVQQHVRADGKVATVSGTGEVVVSAIVLLDEKGREVEVVDVSQPVCLRIEVTANSTVDRLVLGYGIKDRLGQIIYGTNTHLTGQPVYGLVEGNRYVYNVRFSANLGVGTYSVQTALVSDENHLTNNYDWRDLALMFEVVNMSKPDFAGCAWIEPVIEIESI